MKRPMPWPVRPSDPGFEELKSIRGVCLDIDDTLSTKGKLTSEAYSSLWELKNAGLAVVPITGRPAGWCDHFARFWPVDAVVGENGAFTFFMDAGVRRRLDTPHGESTVVSQEKLSQLAVKIRSSFPQVQWASDQSYREFDLAVDICEDVAPWSNLEIERLIAFCQSEGAHAKLSSIHVNVWLGEYDKQKGFEHWLAQGGPGCKVFQSSPLSKDEWIYIGDSPNDEPMFRGFKYSVGVANLEAYLNSLKFMPTWMTQGKSGEGFSEMVRQLVSVRNQASRAN